MSYPDYGPLASECYRVMKRYLCSNIPPTIKRALDIIDANEGEIRTHYDQMESLDSLRIPGIGSSSKRALEKVLKREKSDS